MPAFRFFDPWAALGGRETPASPAAKVANPAKVNVPAWEILAFLAGLADPPRCFSVPVPAAERAAASWSRAEAERAAIVEHDGTIPREWAEGFARLDPDYPPGDVPPCRWQRFVDDVGRFLDSPFCAVAAALGWGPHDLFGCDRDRPFAGIDGAGLIWLLNGDRLVALTHSTATVETRTGVRKTYRRQASGPERVLAWKAGS